MKENKKNIFIKGASEHNLKNIDVTIPRGMITVVTGLSGSGKSSLAFDTLYAEGQRKYVESLSSYARQFLGRMQKPKVEYINGLSPAVAIEQRVSSANPRSTVGTQTEIYDYLRLLFARIGKIYCWKCQKESEGFTLKKISEEVYKNSQNKKIYIYAPVVKGKKGSHVKLLDEIRKQGFIRVLVDGKLMDLSEDIKLHKNKKHEIYVLIDRIQLNNNARQRFLESLETALEAGKGIVEIHDGLTEKKYSTRHGCVDCGISFSDLNPRNFSFNSPYGACSSCNGLGTKLEIDPGLVVPDKTKSLSEGAINPWRKGGRRLLLYYRSLMKDLIYLYDLNLDTPFKDLNSKMKNIILYGSDEFEGVIPNLERRFSQTNSEYVKREINNYMSILACPECNGRRLKKESLSVKIKGKNIYELSCMSIEKLKDFFKKSKFSSEEENISRQIMKEINARLDFMIDVGLSYLSLDRKSETLSGGESERIRLATQIGSGLTGVLYVLDEPSIGLHQKDLSKLLATLKKLRDMGNTLVIVEHDETAIKCADYIIDLGPGAGKHGGYITAEGNLNDIKKNKNSLTGRYLICKEKIGEQQNNRKFKNKYVEILGAKEHNLKNINVKFPVGAFICVTGVSGSGKSTLVNDILYKTASNKFYKSRYRPGVCRRIKGLENFRKVVIVDQSPIGRTPKSNPVTYTGVFSYIRKIFSQVPESKIRGYKPGRFSFNVKDGRCQSCGGDGVKKIEMHFLPDVYMTCQECKGRRYNEQTLEIKYKGYTIADVLDMTVEEAGDVFRRIPPIKNKLDLLSGVGLNYIQLGQPSTTLSGGEAQRIKLSRELSKRARTNYLYILDEPTTGLHFADIDKLLAVLQSLVNSGNTVLVIEHNLEVIKCADYIIDLGPEGGDRGGDLVFQGFRDKIISAKNSYTAEYLKNKL